MKRGKLVWTVLSLMQFDIQIKAGYELKADVDAETGKIEEAKF